MNGEHILAVDPGGTTGLAWCPLECLGLKEDERLGSMIGLGQIDGSVSVQSAQLGRGIVRLKARLIVSESSDHFLLRPRYGAMRKHSLIPIKMSGALQALCGIQNDRYRTSVEKQDGPVDEQLMHMRVWPVVFVEQTPSQAKNVVSEGVLLRLGIRWQNKNKERHQLDAARHLILLLRRYRDAKGGFKEHIDEALDKKAVAREWRLRYEATHTD